MKQHHNRRDFVGSLAAGVAGAIAPQSIRSTAAPGLEPDLVVFNAKVYTVDSRNPRAEAFAVKGDRFVAVGSTSDMKALAGKNTLMYDAKQMAIVPGFIDCHNHAPGTTLLYEVLVGNPYEVEFVSISGIVEKLRARAKEMPPGTWVDGYFFDDTKVEDKRELDASDLDKVSMDHPVVVRHRGGHTSYYNHKALEMAGITKQTPNPPGGTYDRNKAGDLSGRVTDLARNAIERVGTRRTFTPEQREQRDRDGLAFISKQFVRYGLTSVHHEGGNLRALQDVRARGELLHRVSFESSGNVLESMITSGIATGFGDEWIRFGATSEHSVDGSFSERTMALSKPYPGVQPAYQGNITTTQNDLNAWVERVHRAGIQINCHANGDVAIDMMLTAVERAQKLFPRADARPKITHCTLINDDLFRRMKVLNAVPALFISLPPSAGRGPRMNPPSPIVLAVSGPQTTAPEWCIAFLCSAVRTDAGYRPRDPSSSVLYGVIAEELESFLAEQQRAERRVPWFVERELRAFLDCGVLARGFVRVHCDWCGHDNVVPFSCKKRAFCPSCCGRRMADTAAHLID